MTEPSSKPADPASSQPAAPKEARTRLGTPAPTGLGTYYPRAMTASVWMAAACIVGSVLGLLTVAGAHSQGIAIPGIVRTGMIGAALGTALMILNAVMWRALSQKHTQGRSTGDTRKQAGLIWIAAVVATLGGLYVVNVTASVIPGLIILALSGWIFPTGGVEGASVKTPATTPPQH